jgi:DNA-binding SARP family transcriptional activator/tetratricopeptide (TPR) repeat protein
VKYGVLGPLSVCSDDGVEVPIRSRLERTLLAVLLVRAGQVVTVGQLVETLWGDHPPSSYASNLQTYISRLRDRLTRTTIEHVNGGYRLTLPDDDLDLTQFRRAVKAARADDGASAVTKFRAALKEWRGPMLAGMSIPLLASDVAHCDLERLDAAEDCAAAHLAAALPVAGLLPELRQLIAEHPLRERLHALLMRALCRAGRRADALLAYQHARDLLVTELGIEPGAALQRLHQAILKGEDDEPAQSTQFPVCQLPPEPAGFVGRQVAVERITHLLRPGAIVPVVTLSGQPGVGKSTLAVVAAHRIRDAFPDGQIFINLAGASAAPRDATSALADVLRSLGVPGPAIPEDPGALSAAYRAKLADRKVLVLLDDAADPAQIRPLIPGTGGSAVLVTSRRLLSGLVEARHVHLDPLTDLEAQKLLAHMVGAERVAKAPAHAVRIAKSCGNLPLALRIAGTRLATRGLTVEALAERLGDERRRLGELMVGDQQVRASIAFSVAALSPAGRAAFAALGPVGPRSVASWLVSVLLDAREGDSVVEELLEAGLLTPDGSGPDGEPRYRLHDLLRLYAEDLPSPDTATRSRLVAAVLWASDIASRNLPRTVTWSRTATTAGPVLLPDGLAERLRATPGEWFDAELGLLVDFVLQVADDASVLALAERLAPFLWIRGYWTRLRDVLAAATRAGTRIGDRRAVAQARMLEAADVVLGRCLNALAVSELLSGSPGRAHEAAAEAVALLRPSGDRYVYLAALRQLATAAAGLRRRAEAIQLLRESRDLAAELGDRLGRTSLDRDLAVARIGDGDPRSAAVGLERCLLEFERMDIPSGQATTLTMLARAYDELGQGAEARNARRRLTEVRRDPRDLRTPMLAKIMMQLAERV